MSLLITEGLGEEGDVIPGPAVEPPHMYKALVLRPKMIYGGGVAMAIEQTRDALIIIYFMGCEIADRVGDRWRRLLK